MTNSPLKPWVRSVAIAVMATSLMLAVLIIAAEETPALKNWLKATFYHHWLGKGALSLGLFALISIVLGFIKNEETPLSKIILLEAIFVILSVLAIAGFFLLHLLKLV